MTVKKINSDTGVHLFFMKGGIKSNNVKNLFTLFQAIKYIKLNSKQNPCKSSNTYRFAECLEDRIMSEVGCQPFWIKRSVEPALLPCQNASQFDKYLEMYDLLQQSTLDELISKYNCLIPCSHIHYEVIYEF